MSAGRVASVLVWLLAAGLAGPAVLLTLDRIADTDNGTMIRVESFTPFGLPLYALLLVLLLVGALARPRLRRLRLGLAVVAAAGLGLHAWWFAPQVLGDNPAPAPGAERITVMNSNLFAGMGDAQDVVDAVRSQGVEIAVFEEITPDEVSRLDAAGLSDLLPHHAGAPDPDVAGTMVFSSLPIGATALLATTFQSYRVEVGGMTLLAVHPLAPVLPRAWRDEHALILDEAVASDADLVVGDMNATPDHDVMRDLDAAGFRDAGELANEGWQPTWPANHVGVLPLLPPVVRIDHVLLGRSMASLGTHTVDIDGTDHLALIAVVAARSG